MMGSICSNDTTTDTTAPATTIKPFTRSWESYIGEQQLGRPEIMEKKPEQKILSISSLEQLPESSEDVIRDLEQRQYPVVKEALQSTDSINNTADKLMGFMTSGADEFKQRTGRNMTYAEMRAAWG
jgi:hypothetical protein